MASRRIDPTLTAEKLRAALDYDPDTGGFRWRHRPDRSRRWNSRWAGKPTGCLSGNVKIVVNSRIYLAHRLAWLYVTGSWPTHMVDHRDNNPLNNAWDNLRAATNAENTRNVGKRITTNTSGFKGVFWHARARKWMGQIMVDGKGHYLGLFVTREAAHAAYCAAATRLHGDFARFE